MRGGRGVGRDGDRERGVERDDEREMVIGSLRQAARVGEATNKR